MKIFRMISIALFAILMCFSSCNGGSDEPIEPTPKPEVVKSEITIDPNLVSNGLSFSCEKGEQSISFSTNEDWTLSIANTTSGATWCNASATSGTRGNSIVKFTVTENTDYDDRSVSVTIKSGTASKTFKITQKCKEALLVTTNIYEVSQEGGTIDIEVKSNVDYNMEISEAAKGWISESSSRGLTSHKHSFHIAVNKENDKREGEIYIKSDSLVEIVKVYQSCEAVLILSKKEVNVSAKGETISIDVKSNVEFGVQMPDVDWIIDKSSSRGLSSHTMKYIVKPNDTYDNRSAEIIFYDKNSNLKEIVKVTQTQKDAIIMGKKEYEVKAEGETIEVKLESNVDFEISLEDDWVKLVESQSARALASHKFYLQIAENESENKRNTQVKIKANQITETILIKQDGKEDETPYLTFKADTEQTFTMSRSVATLEYSVDGEKWEELGTTTVTFGGNNGNLRLRGKSSIGTSAAVEDYNNYSTILFGSSTPVACSGDIRTLIDYENYTTTSTENARFRYLFKNCTSLTTAPELPAEDLANMCYAYMFYNCKSLIEAPELPADMVPHGGYYHMFEKCSSLKTAPELPAMTVDHVGYNTMFAECTSLVNAPELPATTLIGENHYACMFMNCTSLKKTPTILPSMIATMNCYANMFDGCVNITSAPELPATTLHDWCYDSMFKGCVNLINVPAELPAQKVSVICYRYMFSGCVNLKKAPRLPATELAQDCYLGMFGGCTSLETAPELPAITLAVGCYHGMFGGCTSLKKSPKLEAKTLVSNCYKSMFQGCSNLNEITMLATDISAYNCLNQWVKDVATIGTFYKAASMKSLIQDDYDFDGIPIGEWTVKNYGENIDNTPYVTFKADAEQALTMSKAVATLEYSVNGGEWKTLGTTTVKFGGSNGDLSLRGKSSIGTATSENYGDFAIFSFSYDEVKVSCEGDIRTLVDYEKFETANMTNARFCNLFHNCESLTKAPDLPSMTLADNCYNGMFSLCTNLTIAPELPAMTLNSKCYKSMFQGCESLTSAPELPSKTLADHCYEGMFYSCHNLMEVPELPAITLADYCYADMFRGCWSLQVAPELPATTLASNCYSQMFSDCFYLTTPPTVLPAMDLAEGCYIGMFSYCNRLTISPELPAKTLAKKCYKNMFGGCKSLKKSPELAAKVLMSSCYESMFYNCNNLTNITMLATDITATDCLKDWVKDVAYKGDITISADMSWQSFPTGGSGLPSNWTVYRSTK